MNQQGLNNRTVSGIGASIEGKSMYKVAPLPRR